jgi:hypothetical protein
MKRTSSYLTLGGLIITSLMFSRSLSAETFLLYADRAIPQISFAADTIKAALEKRRHSVEFVALTTLNESNTGKKIILALAHDAKMSTSLTTLGGKALPTLGEQAYSIRLTMKPDAQYWVMGGDANGVMYGGLRVAEMIAANDVAAITDSDDKPAQLNRGMKLNMPLDRRVPTYVGGWSSNSAKKAIPHVWDMNFWKTLIDEQTKNRYNVLTVWVHHPFPALVKVADYPKASIPNIDGFDGFALPLDHDKRVAFWRGVMQYAHDRGMKFYFFNWNIHLEYAGKQYPELTDEPSNPKSIDYMHKSMTALLETYPELDGFGITSGDGMGADKEDNTRWTWAAMGSAVNNYLIKNPQRKFNLIHRGVKSSTEMVVKYYSPLKELPNATLNYSSKYAQAHMYSTLTPTWYNDIQKCSKIGLKTWVTLRNDDYFYLTWGDHKFVRDYLAALPAQDAIAGIYIGIDGYNPSRTYFSKNPALNGQLEVQRRWYMEMLWGRIMYNPAISDDVLKQLLATRYAVNNADKLFDAWTLASRSLPKVTELIMGKWALDFHWYPEGCWSDPSRGTGFRTIDGFANDTTIAKGSQWCDIATSAAGNCNGKKSSYNVADEMHADATKALELINAVTSTGDIHSEAAINNVKHMAYLSAYYAHKIRGATLKKAGKTELARDEMALAYGWWITYTKAMEQTYHADSFRNFSITPNWSFANEAALKEYTDVGGTGIPPEAVIK